MESGRKVMLLLERSRKCSSGERARGTATSACPDRFRSSSSIECSDCSTCASTSMIGSTQKGQHTSGGMGETAAGLAPDRTWTTENDAIIARSAVRSHITIGAGSLGDTFSGAPRRQRRRGTRIHGQDDKDCRDAIVQISEEQSYCSRLTTTPHTPSQQHAASHSAHRQAMLGMGQCQRIIIISNTHTHTHTHTV